MIELPDSATFSATFADPRTYAAMAVSILAGAVRGFSGFGSALIFVPLMSAIYDPRTAAGTFLLIDFAVALAVLADGRARGALARRVPAGGGRRRSRRSSAR